MLQRIEGDAAQTVRGVVPQFPGGIGVCRFVKCNGDEDGDDPSRCRIDGARKVQTVILTVAPVLIIDETRLQFVRRSWPHAQAVSVSMPASVKSSMPPMLNMACIPHPGGIIPPVAAYSTGCYNPSQPGRVSRASAISALVL